MSDGYECKNDDVRVTMHFGVKINIFRVETYNTIVTALKTIPYIFLILTDIGDKGLGFMIPFTDFENID